MILYPLFYIYRLSWRLATKDCCFGSPWHWRPVGRSPLCFVRNLALCILYTMAHIPLCSTWHNMFYRVEMRHNVEDSLRHVRHVVRYVWHYKTCCAWQIFLGQICMVIFCHVEPSGIWAYACTHNCLFRHFMLLRLRVVTMAISCCVEWTARGLMLPVRLVRTCCNGSTLTRVAVRLTCVLLLTSPRSCTTPKFSSRTSSSSSYSLVTIFLHTF